jgi:hypothetical protein
MNTFTIEDIRNMEPCYDPGKYLPEDWQGTALDILRVTDCPPQDRLWVVCREDWIDDKTLRLDAAWCARQALALIDDPDPRSIAACNIAERYANGEATESELAAAFAAAWAARDAAWAAWDAAGDAARDAWDAFAAAGAARDAAWAAAFAAAWAAAFAAARDAARDAAWEAQVDHLIEMLTEMAR